MTLNFEYDLDAVTVSQHAKYRSLGAKRLVWTTVRIAEKEQGSQDTFDVWGPKGQ